MRTSLSTWLRNRIRAPILGLDLDENAVQLLELEPDARRVRRQYSQTWSDEEALSAAENIRGALKRSRIRSRRAAIAMPAAQVDIRRLQLPAGLDDEGLHELLCADATRYLPYPLQDCCFDFERLDAGASRHTELRLYSCARADLEQRCAAPQAAGLQIVAVDLDRYALAAGAAALLQPDEAVALLHLRHSHSELLLLERGRIVYAQALARSRDWWDEASCTRGAGFAAFVASLRAALDPVLPAPAQLLLIGGDQHFDELTKAFSSALGRPCCAARRAERAEPLALLAYGLALRAGSTRA